MPSPLLAHVGYGAVMLAVGIESMGIPFPGETTLIAAAAYAGSTHKLNIGFVIAAAAAGAIIGDNVGFWIGREIGLRLLIRYGKHIGMTERRIKLGQYLFQRYGGTVVFVGRFVAVLRALAAFLAGANRMTWPRFLIFNAAGGIIWSGAYGIGAYALGTQVHRLAGPVGIGLGVVALVLIVCGIVFLRRHEHQLEDEAERALPGPIEVNPRRSRRGNDRSGPGRR